jgi:hypothetical protein
MKYKIYYIFVILAIVTLLILWNFYRHLENQGNASSSSHASGSVMRFLSPFKKDRLEDIVADVDKNIQFYGIITDHEDRPMGDVEVTWSVLKGASLAPSLGRAGQSFGKVKTHSDGRFHVINESGYAIRIESINYPGYHNIRLEPNSFYYDDAMPLHADPTKPASFVLVPDGGVRSKAHNMILKFDWDGQRKEFSWGTKGIPNRIIIIPEREPMKAGERIYNWKITFKMENAKVFLGINNGISLAPESGYVDEIVLEKDVGGQILASAKALIYVKTNDGIYAKVMFSAYSDRSIEDSNTGNAYLKWNPNGGRAIE